MNKYLVIGDFVLGADVLYVGLSAGNITLNYYDKQVTIDGAVAFTAADKVTIEDAIIQVWNQSYTNSTLDVELSQAVTAIL
mgnify:CR=1 FL=1|jgi:hypothetical protein|tara:strand:+ start:224 stop:466 length:243 start_codon:yes stop_codon:yes gene_type:complete